MNKFFFIVLSLLLSAQIAYSEEPLQNILSLDKTKKKEICGAVKKTIQDGVNAKEVVKTGIKLGHSVCLIVKCAIEGGGNLRDIVIGAIEVGATPDVVSRCAINAGVEVDELTAYVMSEAALGFCYYESEGLGYAPYGTGLTPMEIVLPGGDPGGGFISPSSF